MAFISFHFILHHIHKSILKEQNIWLSIELPYNSVKEQITDVYFFFCFMLEKALTSRHGNGIGSDRIRIVSLIYNGNSKTIKNHGVIITTRLKPSRNCGLVSTMLVNAFIYGDV